MARSFFITAIIIAHGAIYLSSAQSARLQSEETDEELLDNKDELQQLRSRERHSARRSFDAGIDICPTNIPDDLLRKYNFNRPSRNRFLKSKFSDENILEQLHGNLAFDRENQTCGEIKKPGTNLSQTKIEEARAICALVVKQETSCRYATRAALYQEYGNELGRIIASFGCPALVSKINNGAIDPEIATYFSSVEGLKVGADAMRKHGGIIGGAAWLLSLPTTVSMGLNKVDICTQYVVDKYTPGLEEWKRQKSNEYSLIWSCAYQCHYLKSKGALR